MMDLFVYREKNNGSPSTVSIDVAAVTMLWVSNLEISSFVISSTKHNQEETVSPINISPMRLFF